MTTPHAFIIEDDEDTTIIFTAALQAAGFGVQVITDGQKAAELLQQTIPDLIVLDLHLPHTSGSILLNQIRTDSRLAHLPVILATADRLLAATLEAEANIVLLKPVSFNQLSLLAKRLYARHNGRAAQ